MNLNLPIDEVDNLDTTPTSNMPNDKIYLPEFVSKNLDYPKDEVASPEIVPVNLNLPINEVDDLDITSENLNFPMDEQDSLEIKSETFNLPMDIEFNLKDIDFLPIHILPDAESNSRGPGFDEYNNQLNCTTKKSLDILPDNTCKSLSSGPSSTKLDILEAKNKNKRLTKRITKSNATLIKKHDIKFLICNGCDCSILDKKTKCMACKLFYCDDCVGGLTTIDYLCDKCLGDSDEGSLAW
ncbi:unnamed protein product [Colias eurytheme]|nr:unnamed protein product [Colias eurytheme]